MEPNALSDRERAALRGVVEHGAEVIDRTRRRRLAFGSGAVAVAVVAALTVAVLLPGFLRPAPVAVAPTPTPSVTETVEPSPTPTPTPTPTETPVEPVDPVPDANDPTTWLVSEDGIGPFRLGMPFSEAAALLPDRGGCGEDRDPVPSVYYGLDSRLWITGGDDATVIPGGLEFVEWTSQGGGTSDATATTPRTAEGLGVGSREADVRAAYPGATEVERNGLYLQSGRVFFGIYEGVVASVGVTAVDIPYEFCG